MHQERNTRLKLYSFLSSQIPSSPSVGVIVVKTSSVLLLKLCSGSDCYFPVGLSFEYGIATSRRREIEDESIVPLGEIVVDQPAQTKPCYG
jgi:hypothetical protein